MKITRIETLVCHARMRNWIFVKVVTDQPGLWGWGEATLEWHTRSVVGAIQDLAELVVGEDPTRIEHLWQMMYRQHFWHGNGIVRATAIAGIDIALWDILGKAVDRPVHQLLGGKCRDKVRVFANVVGDSPAERADSARRAVERGYTSLRTTPFLPGWERQPPTAYLGAAVEIVRAIREAAGFEVDLGLEIHRNLGPDEAVVLARELAPFRILYYEDPVAPESLEALRYVARHVDIPIATGERCHSLFEFKELLDTGAVALIRPDLSLAGGFTQCKKIAALAEASFVGIFPHLMGSPVNLAAYAQLGAAIPNYALMESGSTALNEIVDAPLVPEGGYVAVPDRPGIGVELREEALAKLPYRPHRIAPATRADGAVAH